MAPKKRTKKVVQVIPSPVPQAAVVAAQVTEESPTHRVLRPIKYAADGYLQPGDEIVLTDEQLDEYEGLVEPIIPVKE